MADNKNIIILGATGPTGILTVRTAIDRGYKVTIFARNPKKLPNDLLQHPDISVVIGELSSTDTLFPLVPKASAIVSLLGPNSMSYKGTPIADFYASLLKYLHTLLNPPKLIALGTLSISSPLDHFSFMAWLIVMVVKLLAHGAYNEFVTIAKVFTTEGKGLPWTLFRVGYLSDGQGVGDARAGYVADQGWSVATSKRDIAGWAIKEAEEGAWLGKMPALFPGKKDL